MDINYEIQKLRNEKRQMLVQKEILRVLQIQELEAAKAKINEKYNFLLGNSNNDLDNKINEIYNQCKLIEKYSTFNVKDIGKILASLMSIYEAENYLVKTISYKIKGALFNDIMLIINEKKFEQLTAKNEIQESQINIIVKNGFALKLLEDFSENQFPKKISIYEADPMGRVNQNVNFRSFTYVKNFIEYVINYRIENNLENISFEDLEMLRNQFIKCNLEQIKEYHDYLDEKKRAEFETSLQHDKKVRNRQLQRVLNTQK